MARNIPKGETRAQTVLRHTRESPWLYSTVWVEGRYWAQWERVQERLWMSHHINVDAAQAALKKAEAEGLVEVHKVAKSRASSWLVRPLVL